MFSRQVSDLPDLRQSEPNPTRIGAVLIIASAMGLIAWLAPVDDNYARILMATGLTLVFVAVGLSAKETGRIRARKLAIDILGAFIEKDAAASFATDENGAIITRNRAAAARFLQTESDTLAGTLRAWFANPSAVLYRLQTRAHLDGFAREDLVTRQGQVRISVHALRDQGYLWRIENLPDRAPAGRSIETMPLPMITAGRSGTVLFMNDAARRLIGERAKSLERIFPALPVRKGAVNQIVTANGHANVIVHDCSTTIGRREMFLVPVEDTAGVQHQSVFDTLPVAMIRLSPDGSVLSVNLHADKLLGAEIGPATGLADLMTGLGRPIADWLSDTVNGPPGHSSEFLRLTRKDREVFVQVTLNRITENGAVQLIAVLSDATELKTLEAQFVQSQKMQAIGQLAGGVAHDFNNLLTAISGHCDLLLLRHDHGDQDYGDLVQINENANRAAALVNQLLAFSRKQTLRPETLDLRDTLADLTHLLNRLVGEKVTLTLSHDPVLRPIRADKRQLEQVLMNLVVNARDAMPKGGEIRIETRVRTLQSPLERDRATVPAGDYVTVQVSDDGIGISPDKLSKVFEPFFTTKRAGDGTGLGLSTAYGIVKQTGGFIFADSIPGTGTTFTLYFPVFEGQSAAPEPVVEPQKPTLHTNGDGVILLVEDEATVRAFASRALRLRGYTVLEAESAEQALDMLQDKTLMVDVFVTDVVMPGMNGPTWVRLARETRPDVRVVFVSGYAEGAFGENEPSVPNSVFLPKPFSLNQLTETVHQQFT